MEHTKDSPVWLHWDNWRKKVAGYETASLGLFEWLENRIEVDLFDVIDLTQMHTTRIWLFGNILRTASGAEDEGLESKGRDLVSLGGAVSLGGGKEARLIVAQAANTASARAVYDYLSSILRQAQEKPEWAILRSATTELKLKERQIELRRIANQIDSALVSIELMRALPGRCHLCPV